MESGQNLQRRIRSVKNIGQITKAMELVAATKMRKSQELALGSRPYGYTALEILGIISHLNNGVKMPELLKKREVKTTAFVVMTSDKGLAGSFNSAVIRKFEKYIKENGIDVRDSKNVFIAIGQKAKTYLERRNIRVIESFTSVGDFTKISEADAISELLIEGYRSHLFDRVLSFSTVFVTALKQEVFVHELLPASFESIKQSVEELVPQAGRFSQYVRTETFADTKEKEYLIEPSPSEVLEYLAPELVKIRIYQMILEANASEHSARRVAMKSSCQPPR